MEKLQGFDRADILKRPYSKANQSGTELEALATYVASKSRGLKYRPAPRACQGEGGAGDGRGAVLPPPGTDGLLLRHLPCRRRPAHPPAEPAVPRQARGGAQGGRRVAGLSRVAGHGHDHAAPHRRLLLADAPAAHRLRLGRDGGAHHAISSTRPRAARSPPPPSSASRGRHAMQSRLSSLLPASRSSRLPPIRCCRRGQRRDDPARGTPSSRAGRRGAGLAGAARPGRDAEGVQPVSQRAAQGGGRRHPRAREGRHPVSRRRQADGRLEEGRAARPERLRRPLHGLSRRAPRTAATAMPATRWTARS